MAHLLFLSHVGADTERALRLAAAIEASADARKHGMKVWVDKRPDGLRRLQAGTPWQDQLECAIAKASIAFGPLPTREGARSWLRNKAPTILSRLTAQRKDRTYPSPEAWLAIEPTFYPCLATTKTLSKCCSRQPKGVPVWVHFVDSFLRSAPHFAGRHVDMLVMPWDFFFATKGSFG